VFFMVIVTVALSVLGRRYFCRRPVYDSRTLGAIPLKLCPSNPAASKHGRAPNGRRNFLS
jgi:hypothetical protein